MANCRVMKLYLCDNNTAFVQCGPVFASGFESGFREDSAKRGCWIRYGGRVVYWMDEGGGI